MTELSDYKRIVEKPQNERFRARIASLEESNAALVAAAKRALNVLKAQGESVRPGNALGALDAAIKKATGDA